MAVEALTRGIINKIMHTPITTLKSAARDPESTTVVDVVRKLFNLRSETGSAEAGERGSVERRAAPAAASASAQPAAAPQPAASESPASPLVANQSRK